MQIYILDRPTGLLIVVSPPLSFPMSTYLPSTQQDSISHIGFGCSLPSPSALRTPPKDVQLEEGSVLSQSTHSHGQPESSPMEVDHSPATDLSTLADLASRLRPFLPTNYRWLGQGGLKVAGTRPIDAGGFADIWVGEMEDRKVAVKSYRCYASADYMPTYKVCNSYLVCVLCSLTTDQ